jgi:uncharacterized membrane protein
MLQPFDYLMEVIAAAGLIIMFLLPAMYWNELPDIIPRHFNSAGEPDGYGSRSVIWVLTIVAFVLYAGLTVLNRFPHIFNYPVRITEENADKIYTLGTRLLRIVKTIMIIIFVMITYRTISIAMGENERLGQYIIPVIMISMALPIIFVVYRIFRNKNPG